MTKLFEVQEAMFTRLTSNEELNKSINGVHDSVPDKTNFPYIVMGRALSTPHDTKTSKGERIELTLDVWSASKGKKETINIINLIESALAEDLAIDGLLWQEIRRIEVLEEDIDLFHGMVTFEILLDLEG